MSRLKAIDLVFASAYSLAKHHKQADPVLAGVVLVAILFALISGTLYKLVLQGSQLERIFQDLWPIKSNMDGRLARTIGREHALLTVLIVLCFGLSFYLYKNEIRSAALVGKFDQTILASFRVRIFCLVLLMISVVMLLDQFPAIAVMLQVSIFAIIWAHSTRLSEC